METLDFDNLEQGNIESLVYKQLAVGRYDIVDDTCLVNIQTTTGEFIQVQIGKHITRGEIYKRIDIDLLKEPAVKLFHMSLYYGIDKDTTGKQSLIIFLNQYKEKYLKKGRNIHKQYFYKIYSSNPDELNNPLRERYGAKFIDYEKQIANCFFRKKIHNENGLNGIWATSLNQLLNVVNPNQLYENFGDGLFVLKLSKNCAYFHFNIENKEEIIGNEFIVVEQKKLPIDVDEWKEILVELKDKYER